MRVISKEEDYYDGVQAIAMDKSVVYKRDRRSVDYNEVPHYEKMIYMKDIQRTLKKEKKPRDIANPYEMVNVMPFWVIFCGRLYFGAKVSIPQEKDRSKKVKFFYDPEELGEFMEENTVYKSIDNKIHNSINRRRVWGVVPLMEQMDQNGSERFWNELANKQIVVAAGYPGIERKAEFEVNPLLKEYGFYQVRDSWTAFQEISQWVGGVIPEQENETVDVSDNELKQAKGFDGWSFRRMPQKNK